MRVIEEFSSKYDPGMRFQVLLDSEGKFRAAMYSTRLGLEYRMIPEAQFMAALDVKEHCQAYDEQVVRKLLQLPIEALADVQRAIENSVAPPNVVPLAKKNGGETVH